jgi:hypothetical protein
MSWEGRDESIRKRKLEKMQDTDEDGHSPVISVVLKFSTVSIM